jgi:hypothetical protein
VDGERGNPPTVALPDCNDGIIESRGPEQGQDGRERERQGESGCEEALGSAVWKAQGREGGEGNGGETDERE